MINGLIFKGVNSKLLPTLKHISATAAESNDLEYGKFYDFGTISDETTGLSCVFPAIEEYDTPVGYFQFTLGTDPSFGTLDVTVDGTPVKWLVKPEEYEAGKTYQISMMNGCAEVSTDAEDNSDDSWKKSSESSGCHWDDSSVAIGIKSEATCSAFAFGNECSAKGTPGAQYTAVHSPYAEGYRTLSDGNCSHAEGHGTTAHGGYSHSEGETTVASGRFSHAEGRSSVVYGNAAHAEGEETTAAANFSHAEGYFTMAYNNGEHAEGRYNISNHGSDTIGFSGNTRHSIGCGTGVDNRRNAVEVMENGDLYVSGVGGYNGMNYAAANTLQAVVNAGSQTPLKTSQINPMTTMGNADFNAMTDFGTLNYNGMPISIYFPTPVSGILPEGAFTFELSQDNGISNLSVYLGDKKCKMLNMPEEGQWKGGRTYQVTMVNGCCAIGVFE